MPKIHSFKPIADQNSTKLIIGSMPGAESLRKQQYYGYDRNSFWNVMFTLLEEAPTQDYGQKKAMLLRNGIVLWDVIKTCEREGSLDAKIKNPVVNDFKAFFSTHPNIGHVYFNGRTAYNIFERYVGFRDGRPVALYAALGAPVRTWRT
mgnify:CR=1 FL=1